MNRPPLDRPGKSKAFSKLVRREVRGDSLLVAPDGHRGIDDRVSEKPAGKV
jgi:hypothetical protein